MQRKKTLFAIISLILLATLLLSACSGKEEKIKLSEMEDDLLLQTLTDLGVEIPEVKNVDINSAIRKWIVELEEDPTRPSLSVSWTVPYNLYEDLRDAVIKYQQDTK
ncbi:MAG: hypothetical protein IJB47_02800 [Oscillospiraceae bacterium]|nr:hypothetical protein [Oscillospiraceae bacterium]